MSNGEEPGLRPLDGPLHVDPFCAPRGTYVHGYYARRSGRWESGTGVVHRQYFELPVQWEGKLVSWSAVAEDLSYEYPKDPAPTEGWTHFLKVRTLGSKYLPEGKYAVSSHHQHVLEVQLEIVDPIWGPGAAGRTHQNVFVTEIGFSFIFTFLDHPWGS